jgi:tetratricopeptide (TPR) repeat protein
MRDNQGGISVKNFVIFVLTTAVLCFTHLIAQEEELELLGDEEEETVQTGSCLPEDLSTVYDKLQSDSISDMNIKIFYNFGQEYHKNKNYTSALPYLWKVFVNDTTRYARAAIRKITEAYFEMQMADSTLIAAYRGLEKFPDYTLLHYYAGLLQSSTGRSDCALPHYQALVASEPENTTYLSKLAELYWNINDLDNAIKYQQKVFDLDPTNTDASDRLSAMLVSRDGEGADVTQKKEAWESDPTNMDKALDYGETASRSGEYNEAIKPLTAVILSNSDQKINAYQTRAMCYESLDQYRNAIDDYKKIIGLQPADIRIMCTIGSCYRRLKEFNSGIYWAKKALSIQPGFGLAHITMGEIYEDIVMYCQDKEKRPRRPDDGLVYQLAYDEYKKATRDPSYSSLAEKRMRSVQPYLQTEEEKFMTENRTEIILPCFIEILK